MGVGSYQPLAQGKGVHCQDEFAKQNEVPKLPGIWSVNVAVTWDEGYMSYRGMSHGRRRRKSGSTALSQGKNISKGMQRSVEKHKQNLEVKIMELTEQIKSCTDDVADFKTTGIGHIFVDESHRFKNLMFTTRHDRVAGLGHESIIKKIKKII
jgi:hypothetical protein